MANEIITTLHPDQDPDTNLYPNIKKDNIPSKSINRNKLDDDIISLLNSINELHPSGVDTSTNILAFTTDKGIWVGSDTGKWYYWDGTQYIVGGDYVSNVTDIPDNSITTFKVKFIENKTNNLMPFDELNGVDHTWTHIIDYEGEFEENTKYTLSLNSTFISSQASSNLVVYLIFYYTDNTNSGFKTIMGQSSNNTFYTYATDPSKTLLKIRFQQGNTLVGRFDNMMLSKGGEQPYKSYYGGILDPSIDLGYKIDEKRTSFFDYGKDNLYQPINQIDNYYFNVDGVITYNTNFWYDPTFFEIKPETQYISNCRIVEYDENYNIIAIHGDSIAFTTLSNVKYYRISGLKARKDIAIINEGNKLNSTYNVKNAYLLPMKSLDYDDYNIRKIITITTDDDFVTKMKEAFGIGNCDVYIKSGTYDLSNTDVYTTSPSGIPIGNNCRYYFATNSKIICNYTGDNTSIMNAFSLLFSTYTYGDFELHNFTCETSRIRYSIHDECGSLTDVSYRHIYNNCIVKHDNTDHPNKANFYHALGGGLGYSGEIIISNCYFNAVYTTNGDISYHANSNGSTGISNNSISKVTITGSYFEHSIALSVSSVLNKQIALVTNNSLSHDIYYLGSGTEDKWQTYAYNNIIRS